MSERPMRNQSITLSFAAGLSLVAVAVVVGRSFAEALVAGALVGTATALLVLARRSAPEQATPNPEPSAAKSAPAEARPDTPGIAGLAEMVADSSPDALVLHTDAGKILYANKAARHLFFDGADPSGENFLRLASQAPKAVSEALMGESDRLVTLDLEQQQETFHLMRCACGAGGEDLILLVVRNMTREISRHEVSMLKNVVRVISHEVNNSLAPIASLVHSARLIADRPEHGEKLGAALDTIEERAKHLQAFLEGYAGLARLPAPKPRAVPWKEFLQHVSELYPAARVSGPPAEMGWFDSVQIEQVLINVLKNALEAGSPEQDVEVRVSEDPDGSSRIDVLDRGPGFSDEALLSAFMPFYTTKAKGSGMGHALCREIVHAHGGSISLANREGGGAQVTLVLPGRNPPDARVARSRARLTLSHT